MVGCEIVRGGVSFLHRGEVTETWTESWRLQSSDLNRKENALENDERDGKLEQVVDQLLIVVVEEEEEEELNTF